MGFIKHPFSWAAISSFKSDGETKYCLYYEAMNSLDQQHISFLVLDQQKYISLKEAVNKKEGVTLSVGSTIFNSSKSPVNLPDAIYQDMTNQYHFSIEACLTVNVTKKKYSSYCLNLEDVSVILTFQRRGLLDIMNVTLRCLLNC
jgi:hypothetical protein